MEESTRLGYCIVAGSFVAFQFFFSAVSPQLSLALSRHYSSLTAVKKCEWNSRCVSTLHALIVGLFCLYILFFDEAINANPIWGDPDLVKFNVAISCGYLLYDLLLLLRYWKTLGDSLFVCHHLVALYAYGYVLSRGVLPYFANFRLLSELSTPFVNLRWFFDTVGQPRSSWFVLANGLAMTVVFFLVRIAVIPSYYARMLAWYGTPEYARLGLAVQVAWIVPSLALEVLNLVWMYKIIRGFYRAFCRPREHKLACGHGD
ncbi:TLC domain-containing protein 4-like [Gopherus flavomarginatus]|uniref:TLC domain-containing protein 4-like n=1 Tax=Gopherus flavomarginatus TaxID=286002 RepID=UPI0021CBB993|nr:TLC domain-containing protein 4-like [Gopherus flavomarginatus]